MDFFFFRRRVLVGKKVFLNVSAKGDGEGGMSGRRIMRDLAYRETPTISYNR